MIIKKIVVGVSKSIDILQLFHEHGWNMIENKGLTDIQVISNISHINCLELIV